MEDEFDCAASALLGYFKAVFEEGSFRLEIADHRQRRQLDFSRAVSNPKTTHLMIIITLHSYLKEIEGA